MSRDSAELIGGRYRLVRSLGRGGMGEVWRALDEVLHREVAIKEVRFPDADRRALREARVAARLEHPGIVTVHDVVIHDGRPWIVMELVEGRSLAQVVEQDGALPETEVARIGLLVLDALDLAHRHGVLHRDVKPANILIEGDRVVLTDFGIAAIVDGTALTGTNQVIGSPAYIAPERIAGTAASPAADLWALGVTLYTAVAGRSPFRREDSQATFAAVLASDPDQPPGGDRIWPALAGLLHKDPAQRLTGDRAAALLTPLVSEVTATRPLPGSTRPRPDRSPTQPLRRTGPRIAGLIVVALVVATTAGWVIWRQFGTTADPGGQVTGAGTPPASTTVSSASPTTRPPPPPAPPGFRTVSDDRGYSVAVPETWVSRFEQMWETHDGDQQGTLLQLSVTLAESGPERAALPYLSGLEQMKAANAQGYQLIRLTGLSTPDGGGTAAEWEYTTAAPSNPLWGYEHLQVRAIVTDTGQVYQLTFSVSAANQRTLVRDWDEAQPTLTAILGSFRVTA